MRLLLAAALAFLLSGCWLGQGLYSAGDIRPAMPAGAYRFVTPEGETLAGRVSILADGMTQFEGGDDERSQLAFVPLDSEGAAFVAWERATDDDTQIYILVRRSGDGEYAFFMPRCDGEEAEIARAAGARIEPSPNIATCRFPNRSSLETALRRVSPPPERALMRLVRIPDGQG